MKHAVQKQVLFIHGGDSYDTYEHFLDSLRNWPIERLKPDLRRRWAKNLPENLTKFEVFAPIMPNKQNAQYAEWKILFERHFELLHDDIILIGYSLGGMFLAKYLIEETVPFTIRSLVLIGSPCGILADKAGNTGPSFTFDPHALERLEQTASRIVLFHSKDDPIVPYEHALAYKRQLPHAELVSFDDRNHFFQEEFPELLELVRNS